MAWGYSNAIGSLALPIAMIIVNYPAGADLTISSQNGGTSTRKELDPLKEDVNRRTYFIKKFDTYTLTIRKVIDGELKEVSKDYVINKYGQSIIATLSFRLYIYQNAELQEVTTEIDGKVYYLRFKSFAIAYSSGGPNAYSCAATYYDTTSDPIALPAPYLRLYQDGGNSGNRGGTTWGSYLTDLADTENIIYDHKALISDYDYLYIKCRRILYSSTEHHTAAGTFDSSISGNYANVKFLDAVKNTYGGGTTSDAVPVMLKIPITSATLNANTATIRFAFNTSVTTHSYFYVWDMYLSSINDDVDDPDIKIVTP